MLSGQSPFDPDCERVFRTIPSFESETGQFPIGSCALIRQTPGAGPVYVIQSGMPRGETHELMYIACVTFCYSYHNLFAPSMIQVLISCSKFGI